MSSLPARQAARYGWRRDSPDPRDHPFALPHAKLSAPLPPEVSLRAKMPPVYDQGQLGSCTANAVAAAVEYQQAAQHEPEGQVTPSRLFIYYGERVIEGTTGADAGAEIRDGIKVVATVGAPPETDWPYDISKFAQKPPDAAYADAKRFLALRYGRVRRTSHYLRASLAAGHPVVYGFTVFSSFESGTVARTGIVPMPDESTEEIVGGHAVVAVGYRPMGGQLYFEVRNSWGEGWGDTGYFWVPAAYLLDPTLSSDFWAITLEA